MQPRRRRRGDECRRMTQRGDDHVATTNAVASAREGDIGEDALFVSPLMFNAGPLLREVCDHFYEMISVFTSCSCDPRVLSLR